MKYYPYKNYDISFTQTGDVVSKIKPNKVQVAKSLKKVQRWNEFHGSSRGLFSTFLLVYLCYSYWEICNYFV